MDDDDEMTLAQFVNTRIAVAIEDLIRLRDDFAQGGDRIKSPYWYEQFGNVANDLTHVESALDAGDDFDPEAY